jgi:hypothetical protein
MKSKSIFSSYYKTTYKFSALSLNFKTKSPLFLKLLSELISSFHAVLNDASYKFAVECKPYAGVVIKTPAVSPAKVCTPLIYHFVGPLSVQHKWRGSNYPAQQQHGACLHLGVCAARRLY